MHIFHTFWKMYGVFCDYFLYSSLAQLVERMTVNHDVAGSSPAGGASKKHICIADVLFVVMCLAGVIASPLLH